MLGVYLLDRIKDGHSLVVGAVVYPSYSALPLSRKYRVIYTIE
jgi:hypothetical protein